MEKQTVYTIHRRGNPFYERTIRITSNQGRVAYIDPQEEVLRATGLLLDRHRCILDFAEGLHHAGSKVFIETNFAGRKSLMNGRVEIKSQGVFRYSYYAVGFVWGMGVWIDMMSALQQKVMPNWRHDMLERIGLDCSVNPYTEAFNFFL